MFNRLDDEVRRVMELAQREALALGQNYVGTEHVLVALAHPGMTTAAVLADAGCGPDEIRGDITTLIGPGDPPSPNPDLLLATLGIDLDTVRRRVESTFGSDAMAEAALRVRPRGRRFHGRRFWPNCELGRPHHSALVGGRSFGVAPRLKRAFQMAVEGAAPAPASAVRVLLAILDEGQGVACQILAGRGVDLQHLAEAVRGRIAG